MKPVVAVGVTLLFVGFGFGLRGLVFPGTEAASSLARTSSAATAAVRGDPADEAAARVELDAARTRISDLETRVIHMRAELSAAEESRVAREREFLRFTRGIAELSSLATQDVPRFAPDVAGERPMILDVGMSGLEPDSEPSATTLGRAAASSGTAAPLSGVPTVSLTPAAPTPEAERNRAIFHTLRTLLAAEQVTNLDLLESGNLGDRSVGPVVLRVLDDRGRPLGSIVAERLRLEASRAARMITIVLEQGFERHGGLKVAFEGGPVDADGRGGVRRIALPDCDPRPWLDGLPELFAPNELVREIDDGRHDLGALRATLNQLLHADAAAGWYRVQGIGGVQGVVLRDVALDRLDRDGKLERRFFADRLSILREAQGLQLELEGGSQVRGDQKTPFLDGRCRIFLPRAATDAWIAARVPGLAPDDPPAPRPTKSPDSKQP